MSILLDPTVFLDPTVSLDPTVFLDPTVLVVVYVVGTALMVLTEKLYRSRAGLPLLGRETARSLLAGTMFLATKVGLSLLGLAALEAHVYEHRLFDLGTGLSVVLGGFVIKDLVYYWVHRAEHVVPVLWKSHMVHHSMEDFTPSLSLRVPWMEAVYKAPVYLAFCLAGVHPHILLLWSVGAALLAQAQHTRAFRNPSFLRYVFVVPSTHRVHHGSNPIYLDTNFGAVFSLWDQMFGTYVAETEPVRFGVTAADTDLSFRHMILGGWNHYGRRYG